MSPQTMYESGARVYRLVVSAIGGTATLARAGFIATLSVGVSILKIINSGLAEDLGRYKEAIIRKPEAESEKERADAKKRMAEAAEAATRTGRSKRALLIQQREDELKQAEIATKRAEAAKSEAEAERIRAETNRIKEETEASALNAKAEAYERLANAARQLKLEGGLAFFDVEEIKKLRRQPLHEEQLEPTGADVSVAGTVADAQSAEETGGIVHSLASTTKVPRRRRKRK